MDDFTFPAIPTNQDLVCQQSFPHFAASPLWFLTSAAPDKDTGKIIDTKNKMDMLWEDFNEEFWKVSGQLKKDAKGTGTGTGEQRVVRLSKVCRTRASLVVMLKMLKKLFMLQKTNNTKRSPPSKKL